jgi:hypothetical protein
MARNGDSPMDMTTPAPETASAPGRVQTVRGVLSRASATEALTIAAVTTAVGLLALWTRAPLYNPPATIDPWLYTALWTNFDQTYQTYAGTYYVSRVPWIVPGLIMNDVFDARTASLILHGAFFLVGGGLFYALCRRYLGSVAATLGYVALIANGMYFAAHRWDYQEGAVITFMIAAYAFALPLTKRPIVRGLSLAASGFFAAALVTTRIIDVVYLIGLPLLYWAVTRGSLVERVRRLAIDVAAWVAGGAVLLVAGGIFSHRHGTEFLFFMPQVRVVRTSTGPQNHLLASQWLPAAPYVWLPVFVVALAVVVLVLNRSGDRTARRVLAASAVWLGINYVAFAAWQFGGTGWVLQLGYYFSSFLLPTLLCLTAAIAVVIGVRPISRHALLLIGLGTAATFLPVAWIYRSDVYARVATGYGSVPYLATIGLLGAALVVAILSRTTRVGAVAVLATVVALGSTSYAVASSAYTFNQYASDPATGDLYDVGQELIDFLRANGFSEEQPVFWYDDERRFGRDLMAIQSLYYYAYTFAGVDMALVDDAFRQRMQSFGANSLVLLCQTPACEGAPDALRRSGYAPRLRESAWLRSGDIAVWTAIYRVRPSTS